MACVTTAATLQRNVPGQFNAVVQTDLGSGVRLRGVDVLVFNPPYVPTEEGDEWAGDLKFSWAGMGMGMRTTWKVLDALHVSLLPIFHKVCPGLMEGLVVSRWCLLSRCH